MKRKMLISITLLIVMLLNCIMPLFVVNAAETEAEEIQLNSKLFSAVVKSLEKQDFKDFTSNEITHTLTFPEGAIETIKRLELNEGAIFNLSGLDAFTGLEHLELSGNNITKDSNLDILNNLPNLNYLDLSTNQLTDISEISGVVSYLKENGTIILSGQTVTEVQTVYVDTQEGSDNDETAEFELPKILEEVGYLKSNWKTVTSIKETEDAYAPYISNTDVPMYVNSENSNVTVHIADEAGNGYLGLVELSIYIYDDATEAAQANNENRASENLLNGSRFYLYYVVHGDYSEAITTMDTNLYKAIKEQL